ncbi:MAG: hypothetical protein JOZ45_11070, partial [Acidobacteriaceae bacterium]|nr:hypothetical protein [Acidobacteriaceae bacterium]
MSVTKCAQSGVAGLRRDPTDEKPDVILSTSSDAILGEESMHRSNNFVASLSFSFIFGSAVAFVHPMPANAQSTSDNVIYLNQAWSQDDRDWYYHFSQGSVVLSYDI